jgi:isopenicillin N synthase-like dioxygenase
LRALALGLGLEDGGEEALVRFHSGRYNQLRLLRYPGVAERVLREGKGERMPGHSDWSTVTLLFQDEVGGLQVQVPQKGEEREGEGEWVDVQPVEGGMLMNVGDLLMRWSGDVLRSTMHRVGLPPVKEGGDAEVVSTDGARERMAPERYSIVYFLTTDPEMVIEELEVKGREGKEKKYEPITRREYYAMRAKMQY